MEIPLTVGLSRAERDFVYTFAAMATPCEARIETDDAGLATRVAKAVQDEAARIEAKFSRYRPDSVIGKINAVAGEVVEVDAETARLLDFAADCFVISRGLFDITSGVLRRVWKFDGSDRLPDPAEVERLREFIGWEKVSRNGASIALRPGMEIDFGGLAKEYAVDRAIAAGRALTEVPVLVNFGGDLAVSGPRRHGLPWKVAIASVDTKGEMAGMLELRAGALATSGDAQRYLMKDGIRYSHILDPRTGWPVRNPPRSVTVTAASCIEAGMGATIAMLNGEEAEYFLRRENLRAWCLR